MKNRINTFFGLYQIIGGLGGLLMIFLNVVVYDLNIIFALFLFLITFISGFYFFFENKYLKTLLLLSLFFQIINYKSYSFGFNFKAGAEFSLYLNKLKFDFAFFTFKFELAINQSDIQIISINVVPFIFLFIIRSYLKKPIF
jgi:hypothetical protein